MKHKNSPHIADEHKKSNFWFGFALGTVATASGIFLLGTKKGRETLKKAIELSEGMEETLFENLKEVGVDVLHEVKDNLVPKIGKTFTSLEPRKSKLGAIVDAVRDIGTK